MTLTLKWPRMCLAFPAAGGGKREALARTLRGEETGIASSEVYLGQGVNADNIKKCLDIMAATDREIPISPEAGGDRLMRPSIDWLRSHLTALGHHVV